MQICNRIIGKFQINKATKLLAWDKGEYSMKVFLTEAGQLSCDQLEETATVADLIDAVLQICKPHIDCSRCPNTCCAGLIVYADNVFARNLFVLAQRSLNPGDTLEFMVRILQPDATGKWTVAKDLASRCKFLTREGKCSIYNIRPLVCRLHTCIPCTPSLQRLKNGLYLAYQEALRTEMSQLLAGNPSQGDLRNEKLNPISGAVNYNTPISTICRWLQVRDRQEININKTINPVEKFLPIRGDAILNLSDNALRQQVVYRTGNPTQPMVALTFDDGPDNLWTPQILTVLAGKGVKATFFVLGREVEKNPAVASRIVREGHIIATHGYTHTLPTRLSAVQLAQELTRTNNAIAAATGVQPRLYRPVGGAFNQTVLNVAAQNGFAVIMWSVDPEDWRGINAATVTDRVMANAVPGSIILLHSGEGPNLTGTVQALPQIIDQLRARGLQPVTIPELLGLPAYR